MVELTPNQIERFMSKIIKTNSCWEWTAFKNRDGYGRFKLNGKMILSHRVSYELFKEDIPDGLTIDHLCRNRDCVNPDHLEVVTHEENVKRGDIGLWQKLKTHCPQGHEYTKENTSVHKNKRKCRKCDRIRAKIRYDKKTKLNVGDNCV
jgi:hypothetical protein